MTVLLAALLLLTAALTVLAIVRALQHFRPRPRGLPPASLALCADCDAVQTITTHGTCGACGSEAVLKPWSLGARIRRAAAPTVDLRFVRGSRHYAADRLRGAGRRGTPAPEFPGSPVQPGQAGSSEAIDGGGRGGCRAGRAVREESQRIGEDPHEAQLPRRPTPMLVPMPYAGAAPSWAAPSVPFGCLDDDYFELGGEG